MIAADIHIPQAIGVVLISTGVAAGVSLFTLWVSGLRDTQRRRRESYAKALAACVAYREFPYAIRRRREDVPGQERVRLSEALREIQHELAFYEAWLRLEASSATIDAFEHLVLATRKIAGDYMHDGWEGPPARTDSEVNVDDLDYSPLVPLERSYLVQVKRDLTWWRVWRHW